MFLNSSSTIINSNSTYSIIYENLLFHLGSTYFTDVSFLIVPFISLIGIGLNVMAVRILFTNREFDSTRLYDYMKVYLINSIIVCALKLPIFLFARRFLFCDKIYASFYGCYIYGPLVNGCSMFSSLMDITITLERLSLFNKKFDFIKKYSLIIICVASIASCVLINGPVYLFYRPDVFSVYINETFELKIYYIKTTQFAESKLGSILLLSLLIFRDIIVILFLITLNIMSMLTFKRFLARKSSLFNNKRSNQNTNNIIAMRPRNKNEESTPLDETRAIRMLTLNTTNRCSTKRDYDDDEDIYFNVKIRFNRAERSNSLMVMTMTTMSILEHLFEIITNIFFILSNFTIAYHLGALFTLTFSIKYSLNFPILFLFNINFRNAAKKLFETNV
jgi:hypothetical protein